jgi:transposase-like protein
MAAHNGSGQRRRTRSLDERKRIVEEPLAPGVSVAAVVRRHGLNANLVFKWIWPSREGWRDRRRACEEKPVVVAPLEGGGVGSHLGLRIWNYAARKPLNLRI